MASAVGAGGGGGLENAPDPLAAFHPVVREWFRATLGEPSLPQRLGWPAIASGEHALILAPTGTGKTLAAFLWELNALIVEGKREPLANGVHLLYVSPLKALNNDIQRNLEGPLAQLRALFESAGAAVPEIRVAVRTGDTPAAARARMLRKSPHILITTPESLHIMLTSVKGRGMFATTRAVIVDEIHAVAGTKRGVHLAVTLERLLELAESSSERGEARVQRIGLSATQRPLDEIARFLGGSESGGGAFRPVAIVDCGMSKELRLSIESPVEDLAHVSGSVWPAVAELVLRRVRESRTTLVFVNNRAQAERIAARVNALAECEIAQPYHGSIARELRLLLEQRLKAGELRALVTTSSLELGIDISTVDLVIQLQSPKRVAAALQRVGRAGHALGVASRGILVPTFRDDAMEMAAIVAAMRAGDVEPTTVVQNALDVLAQLIVAAVSVDDWDVDALFGLVRRAYPYHHLPRSAFDEVIAMLSGKYPSDVAAELEARITWDRVANRLTGSRASRMTAVISGGTIPDRGMYTVNLPDKTRLGELDEEFVHESRVGDVFQLGSTTWRIGAIEHDRVVVTPAPGVAARMPFWHGEYSARSLSLSARVGALRRELGDATAAGADASPEAIARIMREYECDEGTANTLVEYVHAQRAATGVVPDDRNIVVEHFRDETSSVRIVIHAAFGGRVNAPWGMALAQRARESLGGVDVQVQTTDDGIMLRLPDLGGAPQLRALLGMSPSEAEQLVMAEVGSSSLFGARFRMNAGRALLLPRGRPNRRMPLWLQRLKALDLLQAVRQYPSFPILVETYREVLQDAFDLDGLKQVLAELDAGHIRVHVVETAAPSPFAASLQFGFVMDWLYGDDTPRAEQRAALLSLDRALLDEVMGAEASDESTLEALEQLLAQRRGTAPGRRARSADELAHLLERAGDVVLDELYERVATVDEGLRGDPVAELFRTGRAIEIPFEVATPFVAADRWRVILTDSFPRYVAAFGPAALARVRVVRGAPSASAIKTRLEMHEVIVADAVPALLQHSVMTPQAARREVLARFVALSGPVTVDEVAGRYGWSARWVESRLTEWQRTGKLVQGKFRRDVSGPEWCSRRVVEGARRRALATLRRQISAVGMAEFAAFLPRWQHVDPRDRLDGAAGVATVIGQLYGIARPAAAWERDYLRVRIGVYQPAWLSELMAGGDVVWTGEGKYDPDTRTIPLGRMRFFERGTGNIWLAGGAEGGAEMPLSENAATVRDAIAAEGASFINDLQRITQLASFALREALRELVASGLVTNDTAEAQREVIRWKPLGVRPASDPERWLPESYVPSPNRRQFARPNVRRLPRWSRPDRPGAAPAGWTGRWSLVRKTGTLGPPLAEERRAELIARQWLERYGIVSRDWWRRERPPVGWRAIYHELRRLEFRGEVRRGYFVRGLAGAQFALPDAVERLRELSSRHAADDTLPFVVLAASDPANPYSLDTPALEAGERDPLSRPRGSGALLVLRGGRVALAVEGRGKRVARAEWLADDDATEAMRVLAEHVRGERGARFL